MTATRIVVWRHGRTEWNATGRYQGQTDIPLDETGLAQARRVAPYLRTFRPALLVASDLRRAAMTAAELATLTGLEVRYDVDLREIDVGAWSGLCHDELHARWPEEAARLRAGEDVRRGGGETVADVAERSGKALQRAAEQAPDGSTVVAVMHGLSGGVGLANLVGVPVHPPVWRGMDNCHWAVCEAGPTGWVIRSWNVGALPGAGDGFDDTPTDPPERSARRA